MYLMTFYAKVMSISPHQKQATQESQKNEELLPLVTNEAVTETLQKVRQNYTLERRIFL